MDARVFIFEYALECPPKKTIPPFHLSSQKIEEIIFRIEKLINWSIVRPRLFRSGWLGKICRTMKPLAELFKKPQHCLPQNLANIKPPPQLSSRLPTLSGLSQAPVKTILQQCFQICTNYWIMCANLQAFVNATTCKHLWKCIPAFVNISECICICICICIGKSICTPGFVNI